MTSSFVLKYKGRVFALCFPWRGQSVWVTTFQKPCWGDTDKELTPIERAEFEKARSKAALATGDVP